MEEDDLRADGAATRCVDDSESCSCRAGPRTLREVFLWPDYFLDMLTRHDMCKELELKTEYGINLYTDWSGMGVPEMSLCMLNESLQGRGKNPVPVRSIRATDINPLCRRVLQAHSPDKPTHVFADIHSRVPREVLDRLRGMTQAAQDKLKTSSVHGKLDTGLRDKLGEQLFLDMCAVLRDVDFTGVQDTCFCHGQQCPLNGTAADCLEKGINGCIIGNECLDWSSVGSRMELCGFGMVTLLIWCFATLAQRPDFIIEECTPRFKHQVLEHVFCTLSGGQYTLQTRALSPTDLGIPVSRPRMWCIILRVDKLRPLIPFDGPTFANMFFRRVELDGSIFVRECGGPKERERFKLQLLRDRGLQWTSRKFVLSMVGKKKSADLLGSGNRVRFAGYKKITKSGVVDVVQNPHRRMTITNVVPTLLRRSVLADVETQELLLPSAHFDVMGIPVHRPEQVGHRCIFASILRDLSPADMRHLTGNAMHTSMAGLCAIYVLAFTRMVDQDAA